MARTSIELPERFHFVTEHKVTITEINYGMHLSAYEVLPIALEAQMQFLASLGYNGLIEIANHAYIMVDCETQFLSETAYGETLSIQVAVANFGNSHFEFIFCFINQRTQKESFRLKAGMLFYDYENKKVMHVPIAFIDKINGLENI
ncbi:MAG: thioesterase family protein [Pseudomonadales bacterium]|nr:thioesterase family protein [Pseudomonadales bacterium]